MNKSKRPVAMPGRKASLRNKVAPPTLAASLANKRGTSVISRDSGSQGRMTACNLERDENEGNCLKTTVDVRKQKTCMFFFFAKSLFSFVCPQMQGRPVTESKSTHHQN